MVQFQWLTIFSSQSTANAWESRNAVVDNSRIDLGTLDNESVCRPWL